LANAVKGNPAAQAGLKRAVVEHTLSKTMSTAEAGTSGIPVLKNDAFQKFVKQNMASLSTVFNGQELKAMTDVAADLQQANRSVTAARIPGGSNTAQDTAMIRKGNMSVLERILWEAAGATAGAATAHPVVGFLAGTVGAALKATRMARVQDLVTELMLDPQKAAAAIAKVPRAAPNSIGNNFAALIRSRTANETGRLGSQYARQQTAP